VNLNSCCSLEASDWAGLITTVLIRPLTFSRDGHCYDYRSPTSFWCLQWPPPHRLLVPRVGVGVFFLEDIVAVAWRCQYIQFVEEYFGSACWRERQILVSKLWKEHTRSSGGGQRDSLVCGRASPIVLSTKCNFGLLNKQVLFVSAFAELQKVTVNLLMSVRRWLSIRLSA